MTHRPAPASATTAELLEARHLLDQAIVLARVIDHLDQELRLRHMAGFDLRPAGPSRRTIRPAPRGRTHRRAGVMTGPPIPAVAMPAGLTPSGRRAGTAPPSEVTR
jgi:hypothetical protein